jgi:hypothetical protein
VHCLPRGGAARETTGILMWSKVYLVRNENNQEIGVALMDTQVNIDDQKFSGYLLYLKEEVVILKENWPPNFFQNVHFK